MFCWLFSEYFCEINKWKHASRVSPCYRDSRQGLAQARTLARCSRKKRRHPQVSPLLLFLFSSFLRWHDPNQVYGSRRVPASSQPVSTGSPVLTFILFAVFNIRQYIPFCQVTKTVRIFFHVFFFLFKPEETRYNMHDEMKRNSLKARKSYGKEWYYPDPRHQL